MSRTAVARSLADRGVGLPPAGFAATLGTYHDVAPAAVLAVLEGRQQSKTLPVKPAVAAVRYLAARDWDKARRVASLDGRKKVADAIGAVAEARFRAAANAEAAAFRWTVEDTVAAVAAAAEADPHPALQWPEHAVRGAHTSAKPTDEVRVEALVRLFDGPVAVLDTTAAGFDLAEAVHAVLPLVWRTTTGPVTESWSGPKFAELSDQARIILCVAQLGSNFNTWVDEEGRTPIPGPVFDAIAADAERIDEAVSRPGRLKTAAGRAGRFADASELRVRLASATLLADPANLHGDRSAAHALGVDRLADLTDGSAIIGRVVAQLDTWAGSGPAVAAFIEAVTLNGARARKLPIFVPHNEVLALGPAVLFAMEPTVGTPTSSPPLGTWYERLITGFRRFGWTDDEFAEAAHMHPTTTGMFLDALLSRPNGITVRDLPAFLLAAAHRHSGLATWVAKDEESAKRLAAAAAELSYEQWCTLYELIEGFRGTPEELVAVAITAAP